VEELQKLKETDYLPPSMTDEVALPFPGLMICPSVEALHNSNATLTGGVVGVTLPTYAVINPFLPWGDSSGSGTYVVCPAVVRFTSPATGDVPVITAQCIDFTQTADENPDLVNNPSCDQNLKKSQYARLVDKDPTVVPWVANSADNVILIEGLQSNAELVNTGENPKPNVALLYSDKSMFRKPGAVNPDKAFDDYRKIFSLSVADRVLVAQSAYTNLYVKKYIRDKYPTGTTCDIDDFETSQDTWARLLPTCNCGNNNNTNSTDSPVLPASTLSITYDTLTVTRTCHLSKHPLVFGDVLGIVGGGVAIVLAITLLLSRVISYFATRGDSPPDAYGKLVS
jgi:hypothetical protein